MKEIFLRNAIDHIWDLIKKEAPIGFFLCRKNMVANPVYNWP